MRKNVRITKSDMDTIKIEALREFIRYANSRPFWKRLKFALLVIFRRLGGI